METRLKRQTKTMLRDLPRDSDFGDELQRMSSKKYDLTFMGEIVDRWRRNVGLRCWLNDVKNRNK